MTGTQFLATVETWRGGAGWEDMDEKTRNTNETLIETIAFTVAEARQ